MLEESPIDPAASFKKQRPDAEQRAQSRHRARQIIALRAGKQVGHAVLAQLCQIGIANLLPQNRDGVIPAHIVLPIVDAARRIDANGELAVVAVGDMGFPRAGDAFATRRSDPLDISLMVLRPTIHPSAAKASWIFS